MQPRLLNNRYELHEPLGKGGMATVYRGVDTRLGRPVAIKLLHPQYVPDDEFRRRFEHEAQAAAGLSSHPNIVDVYDVGQQDGVPYIVMELIEGGDLKTIIDREGPLAVERTLAITQQAAAALEYAHTRGLVHRDIKPQNIMVSPDGTARITDFGIAKSHLSTAVTQAGMTFGTADYISPEQAQGLPASPRSDIYSLGVVVYEMLARHLPFTGDSPMSVALQHIQQPPPPLRQWNPSVPPTLERIVMTALAKDPRQRPASARAFATALREYRNARMGETMAVPVVPRQPPAPPAPGAGATDVMPAAPQRSAGSTAPMPAASRSVVQSPPARRPPPAAVPPPPLYEPQRRRGSAVLGFILGLLLLAGLLGLAYVAFATGTLTALFAAPTPVPPTAQPTAVPPTTTPAPTSTVAVPVQVPKLLGQMEVDVVAQLEQLGLKRGVKPARNHPAPAGTVIEQQPAPGYSIPKGSTVTIVVSLGPALATLPNVANQPFDVTSDALQKLGFKVQRRDQPSATVPPGSIISQEPGPGQVPEGAVVTLVVSQGDLIPFPPVIGRDRAEAEATIRATPGLSLVQIDEQGPDRVPNYSSFRPNEVISATANGQPVQNNQPVVRGAEIVLGVRSP
jgi:serine/threonine-protein kinase